MKSNYVLIDAETGDRYGQLDFIHFADTFKLYKGVPLAKGWPKKVVFPRNMDAQYKHLTELADYFCNPNSCIVASPKLQAFLKKEKVPSLEFLPVTITAHKRLLSADYVIAHLSGTQDCIDVKASGVTWNPLDKTQILSMKQLILNEKKIDPKALIFRARGLVNQIFVKRSFADKMAASGLTGFRFWEVSDYAG